MKSMIAVLCLALVSRAAASAGWAGPPANIALSSDGRNVLDTPEVAHAKAAHLAALAQAHGGGARSYQDAADDGAYRHDPRWDVDDWQDQPAAPQWNAAPAHYASAPQWNAPAPAPQWNAPAPSPQWNAGPAHFAPAPQWNAAPAHWNAGAPAPVADTPEVAQAKAAHLAALSAAKAAAAPAPQWSAAPAPQWSAAPAPAQWNGAPSWHAAPAPIRLSHDGQNVLDTPEVAAARAAHLQAHAQAAHSAPVPAHAPAHNHW